MSIHDTWLPTTSTPRSSRTSSLCTTRRIPARRSIFSDHARFSSSLSASDACGKRVATVHMPWSRCKTSLSLRSAQFIVAVLVFVLLFSKAGSALFERDAARHDRRAHSRRQFVAEERRVVALALQRARLDAP